MKTTRYLALSGILLLAACGDSVNGSSAAPERLPRAAAPAVASASPAVVTSPNVTSAPSQPTTADGAATSSPVASPPDTALAEIAEAAPSWLTDRAAVSDALNAIRPALGATYAGMWIDEAGRGHIAGTDQPMADAALGALGFTGLVDFHVVSYSWDQLYAEQTRLEQIWLSELATASELETSLGNLTIRADSSSNKVIIECMTKIAGDCDRASAYVAGSAMAQLVVTQLRPGNE